MNCVCACVYMLKSVSLFWVASFKSIRFARGREGNVLAFLIASVRGGDNRLTRRDNTFTVNTLLEIKKAGTGGCVLIVYRVRYSARPHGATGEPPPPVHLWYSICRCCLVEGSFHRVGLHMPWLSIVKWIGCQEDHSSRNWMTGWTPIVN